MIIGTGIDILDIRRIEGVISRQGDSFLNKIYTKQEREFCYSRKRSTESLAKIFSIKEAVIKAISDVSGVFWCDIEVFHDTKGKPFVELQNKALEQMKLKTKGNEFNIEVSVSDEIPYVCAFVVIEKM